MDASSDVIRGNILIYDIEAYVLIDPGATHSFVSPSFACKLARHVERTRLCMMMLISTPMNSSQVVEYVFNDCKLRVEDKEMTANLILLSMSDFDIILGMDWLSANHAVLDCYAKTVMFPNPTRYVVKFNKNK